MHTNSYVVKLEDGFYYRTEDSDLEGPFPSMEIAQQVCDAYLRWLDEDHHIELRKMRNDMGL
jgi:hypothetical protein